VSENGGEGIVQGLGGRDVGLEVFSRELDEIDELGLETAVYAAIGGVVAGPAHVEGNILLDREYRLRQDRKATREKNQ